MVSRHIVWLVQNALGQRDFERFGVGFFLRNGFKATVVDLGERLLPQLQHNRSVYDGPRDFDVRIATSDADLDACLPLFRQADLIISAAEGGHVTPTNRRLLSLVGRSGTPWLCLSSNAYPGWSRYDFDQPSRLKRAWDMLLRLPRLDPAASLVARLPQSWMGIRPAAFNVVGGRKCFRSTFVGAETRVIKAHAMDYDLFVRERDANHAQRDIAVFVDEFRPYHPDNKTTAWGAPVRAETYYPALRRLFDRIEAATGLKVVIAACPRADYSAMGDPFGPREIHMYKTAQLIAQSRLVIGHRSTALAYAVLFGRPLFLCALDEQFRHMAHRPYFEGYSEAVGKPVHLFDDPDAVDLAGVMEMDHDRYDAFIADYVKQPGTPDKPYWEIVLDELRQTVFS